MTVILLCAGQSSRMQPLGNKLFFEFEGKALILHQIQWLYESGYSDIIIVGNDENISQLKKVCKQQDQISCSFVIQKNTQDGMKGAIESCVSKVKKDAFVINVNDIVKKTLLLEIRERSQNHDDDIIICGKVVSNYFPGGYLSINNNSYLKQIIEKPGEGNEPSDLVNIVVHYFRDFHNFIKILKTFHNDADSAYEQALNHLCPLSKIYVLRYNNLWQAIKYPWHILDIMNVFFTQQKSFIHPEANISKTAIIQGNVIIQKGVKVFDNAVIVGPAYIGENSIIAHNALVRSSYIGENCVIGYSTEIARSYLRKNIWTHSNYIGDSIIDDNVSFGAGTKTGNLRFDEKNIIVEIKNTKTNSQRNKLGSIIGSGTRIGVNVSTNPGIKIGKNCFIGSQILLHKNVNNNQYVCVKQDIIYKENISKVDTQDRDILK
jgi:UDP-N-acetylglucosamine diphosphorylase / glucose-1-phosphate thymidylyltransferase / UDP-N-acetylgalactosamine diphosphorylase / glucosamine-1-phosphate N-acetyltransferase / galactosamine-1-phosphate N-acetyltransferase